MSDGANHDGAGRQAASRRTLWRRYRRWLRAYPPQYRLERGDELLGTLLELRRPGQRHPAPAEVAALVTQGLRLRSGTNGSVTRAQLLGVGATVASVLFLATDVVTTTLELIRPTALRELTWPVLTVVVSVGILCPIVVIGAVWLQRYYLALAVAVLRFVPAAYLALFDGSSVPGLRSVADLVWCATPPVLLALLLDRPRSSISLQARHLQISMPSALILLPTTVQAIVTHGATDAAGHGPFGTIATGALWLSALVVLLAWGAVIDPYVAVATGLLMLEQPYHLVGLIWWTGPGGLPMDGPATIAFMLVGVTFFGVAAFRARSARDSRVAQPG